MLLDGEVDAAILGSNMPKDARLKALIPDADAAALPWSNSAEGARALAGCPNRGAQ
jgi:hypothetical protein